MADPVSNSEELRQAFAEHDRRSIINNIKVGCWIGGVLMPVGVILDYFDYGKDRRVVLGFLALRLACSLLIALFYAVAVSPFGQRHPRKLGVTLAMLPTFFISVMIYREVGAHLYSPMDGRLQAGQSYHFRIRVPGAAEVAVVCGKEWSRLEVQGDLFEGNVTVANGEAGIFANFGGEKWEGMVRYVAS